MTSTFVIVIDDVSYQTTSGYDYVVADDNDSNNVGKQ